MCWQPKIFIDIDDVLSEFVPYILFRLGAPIKPFDYSAYPEGFGWDLIGAANQLIPGGGFDRQSFWDAVTPEIWASVPKAPMADDLLDLAADVAGRENVEIISSMIPHNSHCAGAKFEWAYRELPGWLHGRIHLTSGGKASHARPGRLLIDDATHNVDAWQEAGGETLQWARPWNTAPRLDWPQLTEAVYRWKDANASSAQLHVA